MKQVIVLVSSILLGIALSTMIIGFQDDATALVGLVNTRLTTLTTGL